MTPDVSPEVFISYAREDMDVARALAEELRKRGVNAWYDTGWMKAGSSVRDSIDAAILRSRRGITILSPAYFAKLAKKEWLWKELNALEAKEASGAKVIFPIWHNVGRDFIAARSPLLADLHAPTTDQGIPAVVDDLLRAWKTTGATAGSRPTRRTPAPKSAPRRRAVIVGLLGIALAGTAGVLITSRILAGESPTATSDPSRGKAKPSGSDGSIAPALPLDSATEHPEPPRRIRIEGEPTEGGPRPAF